MKKPFLYAVAIASLLLGTCALYAQEPPQQGGGQWSRGQMPTADQRLQRYDSGARPERRSTAEDQTHPGKRIDADAELACGHVDVTR